VPSLKYQEGIVLFTNVAYDIQRTLFNNEMKTIQYIWKY
jgi:hypothetical protein